MEIIDRCVSVNKHEAMARLKPMLNGYFSNWNESYIGVTTHPRDRARKHSVNGWLKMVLMYRADNPRIAAALERDLIDYARRCNFRIDVLNVGDGGENTQFQSGHVFLYLLLR